MNETEIPTPRTDLEESAQTQIIHPMNEPRKDIETPTEKAAMIGIGCTFILANLVGIAILVAIFIAIVSFLFR
jgi:hypothetical protein